MAKIIRFEQYMQYKAYAESWNGDGCPTFAQFRRLLRDNPNHVPVPGIWSKKNFWHEVYELKKSVKRLRKVNDFGAAVNLVDRGDNLIKESKSFFRTTHEIPDIVLAVEIFLFGTYCRKVAYGYAKSFADFATHYLASNKSIISMWTDNYRRNHNHLRLLHKAEMVLNKKYCVKKSNVGG